MMMMIMMDGDESDEKVMMMIMMMMMMMIWDLRFFRSIKVRISGMQRFLLQLHFQGSAVKKTIVFSSSLDQIPKAAGSYSRRASQ
jgi:hypothetical protein